MSGPGCCLSFRTSAAGSPFTSRVAFHDTRSSVRENTTFGNWFIRSATTGSACSA